MPNFAELAKPLTLTRKDPEFTWAHNSKRLSRVLRIGCVVDSSLPEYTNCRCLKDGDCRHSVQVRGGIERPIAYASRRLNTAEQAYSASETDAGFGMGDQVLPLLSAWKEIPS